MSDRIIYNIKHVYHETESNVDLTEQDNNIYHPYTKKDFKNVHLADLACHKD